MTRSVPFATPSVLMVWPRLYVCMYVCMYVCIYIYIIIIIIIIIIITIPTNPNSDNFNDNFSVKFDISNITDEPEFYYWGSPDRLSQYDVYGTTYSIGIRYNL